MQLKDPYVRQAAMQRTNPFVVKVAMQLGQLQE